MRILISCLAFNSYTGSELYVYELAKELSKEHDIDIISNIGGDLVNITSLHGIKCHSIKSPPHYFLGDGEKTYTINGETKVTQKNKFYRTSKTDKYDLILLNQPSISKVILDLYEGDAIQIIHSEVLPNYEHPLKHERIKGYIAIRQSIKDYLIKEWGINEQKIRVIYNPIDNTRFNTDNVKDGGYILFVGSYDYLRKQTISDLITYSELKCKELWLVGRGYPNFLQKWVKTFEPAWNIEEYTKNCSEVASVLMGRTAIEGWMCGKKARIYNIDNTGNIKGIKILLPHKNIEKFYTSNVTKEILNFKNDLFSISNS